MRLIVLARTMDDKLVGGIVVCYPIMRNGKSCAIKETTGFTIMRKINSSKEKVKNLKGFKTLKDYRQSYDRLVPVNILDILKEKFKIRQIWINEKSLLLEEDD